MYSEGFVRLFLTNALQDLFPFAHQEGQSQGGALITTLTELTHKILALLSQSSYQCQKARTWLIDAFVC